MELGRRCDFHMHSILSDGELIASEIARRADALGHQAIAITDHVDKTNLKFAVSGLVEAARDINSLWEIRLLVGVELTHVPYQTIGELAKVAKKLGANIVVVHGETPAEPVLPGTNGAAVRCRYVDILAHPGMLSLDDARIAAEAGKYAEITAKAGHDRGNPHVAKVCAEVGLKMLVNSDFHTPRDFITQERALGIATEAGMESRLALMTIRDNPRDLLSHSEIHCRR